MSVSIQPSATTPTRRAPAAAKRLRLLLGSSALVAVTLAVPALGLLVNVASAQTFGGDGGFAGGFSGGTGGGDGTQGGSGFFSSGAGGGGGGAGAAGGSSGVDAGGAAGSNGSAGGNGVGSSGGGGGGNGFVITTPIGQFLSGTFAGGAGGSTPSTADGLASGGGGAGGVGLQIELPGPQTLSLTGATVSGGAGGAAGAVLSTFSFVGGGGGGGGGSGLIVGTNSNYLIIDSDSTVRGGAGGDGGDGLNANASGGIGGAGGAGIQVRTGVTNTAIYNAGSIVGGGGATGGLHVGGPALVPGGASGSAIQGDAIYIENTGTIYAERSENGVAGNGITGSDLLIYNRAGGSIAGGETGAEAVAGSAISASNSEIINEGEITGGMSAVGGGAGTAIIGNNLTIANRGQLTGGFDGNSRGTAIQMGGTANRLELYAGSSIVGAVNATGTTNTLAFAGGTDQTFNVGTLGGQYSGFNAFEKTGTATLVLSGATTEVTPWVLRQGTLSVAADASLGASTGDLTFNGGTLLTTSSFASARNIVLEGSSGAYFSTNSGVTTTLSGVIADSAGQGNSITKEGAGTLVLSGVNTYGGGANIKDGTLSVSADANLGASGETIVFSGGTLATTASFASARNFYLDEAEGRVNTDSGVTTTLSGVISGASGSAFSKLGAGTLVLSGVNTYSGSTNLNAGTLSVSADANLGASGGAIVFNGGTLATTASFDSARNVSLGQEGRVDTAWGVTTTLSGVMTGRSISKYGTGTLVLSGANTYNGTTFLYDGTLSVSADSNLGAGNGAVVLAGGTLATTADFASARQIYFDEANGLLNTASGVTTTLSGLVSGASGSSLYKIGAGTLVLSGVNTYSGNTNLNGGTLSVSADANLGASGGAIAFNGGTLATTASFDSARDIVLGAGSGAIDTAAGVTTTLSGAISGTGTFAIRGGGLVDYTGTGSVFAGDTSVSGALAVNGSLGGLVNVVSGGRLSGNGTVGAASVASGGTVAPGGPTDNLRVTGNMGFAAGSTYEVQTAGTAQASLLSVGGTATLGGAGVSVTDFDATVNYGSAGHTYRILQAGSLSGEFSPTVLINSAFLTPTLSYTLTEVNLTLAEIAAPPQTPLFSTVARSANELATAGALDALDQTAGSDSLALYNAVLFSSADEARAAFNQVSGEGHASVGTALIVDAGLTRDTVGDRLRAAFDEGEFPAGEGDAAGRDYGHGMVGWGRIHGNWGSADGNGNAAKIERDTAGFLLGVDTLVGDIARIGMMAGYSTSNVDVPGRGFSSDIGSATVGLYGGTELAGIGLSGGVSHTWQQIDTTRQVSIGGFANTLTADYDARTTQVFGEVGYKIRTAAAIFEPFAALAHVHLDSDGYAETGGAALSSGSRSDDATFATLGARATTGFMLGSMAARANASLAWQHAFGDLVPLTTVALAGGNGFIVAGAPMARDAALVRLGLDMDVTETTVLGVSYGGQFGDGTTNHEARLDLSVRF